MMVLSFVKFSFVTGFIGRLIASRSCLSSVVPGVKMYESLSIQFPVTTFSLFIRS